MAQKVRAVLGSKLDGLGSLGQRFWRFGQRLAAGQRVWAAFGSGLEGVVIGSV